jgi:hypothetical protein
MPLNNRRAEWASFVLHKGIMHAAEAFKKITNYF